ncbi:MAG: ribonuclease T2 family protein [Methylovirgula sp.]
MNFILRFKVFAAATLCGLGLAGAPLRALAQDAMGSDCILDNCADKRPPVAAPKTNEAAPPAEAQAAVPAAPDHGTSVAPGNFDFYVLALSWSPGFCATGGAAKARSQCASGSNLGFVVHGLWPQNTHGFPSNCGPAGRYPSRVALQETHGLYPDEGLARHEWNVHGTCSGKSPTDYFADVRRARATITIPPPFQAPHQSQRWAAIDVQRAFMAANPRLRSGMMSVECSRSTLSEVRICLSKDLRNFVACPEVARHFCFGHEMTVPPLL